jgi:hypothetical protein
MLENSLFDKFNEAPDFLSKVSITGEGNDEREGGRGRGEVGERPII